MNKNATNILNELQVKANKIAGKYLNLSQKQHEDMILEEVKRVYEEFGLKVLGFEIDPIQQKIGNLVITTYLSEESVKALEKKHL